MCSDLFVWGVGLFDAFLFDWFRFVWLRNSRAAGMRLLDVFDVDIFNLAMSDRLDAVLWLFRIDSLFRSFLNEGN